VTYTVAVSGTQGITVSPPSATGTTGEKKDYSVVLPTGYTNPVATPAGGTFSSGITVGTYNFSVVIGSSNADIKISATPPTPLYSISGKVVRSSGLGDGFTGGATVTLSGKSVLTDANGDYTFTGMATGNYVVNISLFGWVFSPSFRDVGVNNADSTGNNFMATIVSPTVEMTINVLYKDASGSGATSCLVEGASLVPLTLGTTFAFFLQKPGESSFTYVFSATVQASMVGSYLTTQLYYGDGFYDTLPDGTKKYWASGIATFKVEITTAAGVKTSVIAKVGVLMGYVTFGPLQQVTVAGDGKSIKLTGSFPTAPVAKLYKFIPFPIRESRVLVPNNFVVTVPPGFSSSDTRLVVIAGYPNAECSTVFVNIPAPQ